MNVLKTMFLMTALTLILIFTGSAIAGQNGAMIAFLMALVMNGVSYWFSDKIVLSMYGARPVSEAEVPAVYRIVADLTRKAGMPMPKIYLMNNATPNAFATGRDPHHAAVAVTTGIVGLLNQGELTGVIAHELAHIRHRDILIGSMVATMAGAISMLANMAQWGLMFGGGRHDDREGRSGGGIGAIAVMILAPLSAMLIQMAISRSREYAADAGGARLCGNPLWLASALKKLHGGVARIPMNAHPEAAHMFIVSPLTGGSLLSLFSTHPPMLERVARLEAMRIG